MFFQNLADRAALALDRLQLFTAEQAARAKAEAAADRMERLQHVTSALAREISPERAAQVLVSEALPAMNSFAGTVTLFSEDRTELVTVYSQGYAPGVNPPGRRWPLSLSDAMTTAAVTGEPVLVHSEEERARRFPPFRRPIQTSQAVQSPPSRSP